MDIVPLLIGASSSQAGSIYDTGTAQSSCSLTVTTSGSPSFSVQLQGSADGSTWASVGSALTTATTASLSPSPAARYFRAILSGYTGPGTVAAKLSFTAGTGYTGGATGSGITPPAGDLGGTATAPTVTVTHLSSPLPVAQGGTNAGTQQGAINSLTGSQSAGKYLRSDGTNAALTTIQGTDVPTLNQNTTGSAGSLSATLGVGSGGTGQTAQQAAINALSGTQSSGKYLRSDGTNATLAAIQAADVPTLNQSTSGNAAGLSSTLAVGSGGTGQTSAAAAFNALSPNTTLGDVTYGSGTNTSTRLAGNTSSTKNFMSQTGNGTISAVPAWGTIAAGDLPAATTSTQGAVILDGTAGDIQPLGTSAGAGNSTKAAAANHVHSWGQAAPAGFTPANPASTVSATLVMMGLGSTCVYTPAGSGLVLVNITGCGQTATAATTFNVGPRYGTGTAPVNGAAVSGTNFGEVGTSSVLRGAGTALNAGFAFTALLTLTPSTAYWFDLAVLTGNTSDAASLQNVSITLVELP